MKTETTVWDELFIKHEKNMCQPPGVSTEVCMKRNSHACMNTLSVSL